MSRALERVSVEEYLASEELSPIKRDYVGGRVYDRADTINLHNTIAGNILAALHCQRRGEICHPFCSLAIVRIQVDGDTFFYHPDIAVTCRRNSLNDIFLTDFSAIFEVISEDTRRIDDSACRIWCESEIKRRL